MIKPVAERTEVAALLQGKCASSPVFISVAMHDGVGLLGEMRALLVMVKQDIWRAVTSSLC